MERKIGEIFEYDGEWYQCMEGNTCNGCAFYRSSCGSLNNKGRCRYNFREDATNVIFKKLEKVGEPYEHYGKLYQCYKLPMEIEIRLLPNNCNPIGKDNLVEIEIKQNKEDMGENGNNRKNCAQCGDKRFEIIARAKTHLLEATNIASNEKEMAIIDNILFRCYQMGWLERYEKETEKLDLKPFDIQKAREGKPVCTRDGHKARIICFDRKFYYNECNYTIVAMVNEDDDNDNEFIHGYTQNGLLVENAVNELDLMMLPEKKEGWVNVYRDCDGANITKDDNIYSSKDAAIASAQIIDGDNYIATTIIKWEE